MADQKITQLTEDTAPTSDNYFVEVDDVAGTPVTKFVKGENLHKATGTIYALYTDCALSNPSDATTYYMGHPTGISLANSTTTAIQKIFIPKGGAIKRVDIGVKVLSTLGTTETSTIYMRLNNSSDTTLSSALNLSSAYSSYSWTGSVAVVAGDYVEIKWVTPTWVTNPTNVTISALIYVE